jgi:peptide deformylase
MSVKKLVILPDARLRQISAPIAGVDKALRAFIDDMFETMYDAPGIGLAAIQVGEPKRLFTLDVSKREENREPMVVINPEITWKSEEVNVYEEGCLSIPEYYEEVERPAQVRLKYRDIDFVERELEADGLLATCIQHELDHLNGVLFIDHISKLKRDRVIKKFTKLAKRDDEA